MKFLEALKQSWIRTLLALGENKTIDKLFLFFIVIIPFEYVYIRALSFLSRWPLLIDIMAGLFLCIVLGGMYLFSTRRRMAIVIALIAVTFVSYDDFLGNPLPKLHSLLDIIFTALLLPPAFLFCLMFARWRWIALSLCLLAQTALLIHNGVEYVDIRLNDYPKAADFLANIGQFTVYQAEWKSITRLSQQQPDSGTKEKDDDSAARELLGNPLAFPNMKQETYLVKLSPEETKSVFSHGIFEITRSEIWKGSSAAVATMRDGTEKMLRFETYQVFYRVDGIRVLFMFDTIGKQRFRAILKRCEERQDADEARHQATPFNASPPQTKALAQTSSPSG